MRRLRRTLTYLLTYVVRRVAYRRLSHHRVRLAWSGLSVGEHADVVSQERRIQHLRTELRVHLATHTHTHTHTHGHTTTQKTHCNAAYAAKDGMNSPHWGCNFCPIICTILAHKWLLYCTGAVAHSGLRSERIRILRGTFSGIGEGVFWTTLTFCSTQCRSYTSQRGLAQD